VTKKQFYVYAIYVDGVIRYIGKGSNGRVHFHVIEARRINSRRARGANSGLTASARACTSNCAVRASARAR
jgi:hypothetical protein